MSAYRCRCTNFSTSGRLSVSARKEWASMRTARPGIWIKIQAHRSLHLDDLRCPDNAFLSNGRHFHPRLVVGADQERDHTSQGKISGIDRLVLTMEAFAEFQRHDLALSHHCDVVCRRQHGQEAVGFRVGLLPRPICGVMVLLLAHAGHCARAAIESRVTTLQERCSAGLSGRRFWKGGTSFRCYADCPTQTRRKTGSCAV